MIIFVENKRLVTEGKRSGYDTMPPSEADAIISAQNTARFSKEKRIYAQINPLLDSLKRNGVITWGKAEPFNGITVRIAIKITPDELKKYDKEKPTKWQRWWFENKPKNLVKAETFLAKNSFRISCLLAPAYRGHFIATAVSRKDLTVSFSADYCGE